MKRSFLVCSDGVAAAAQQPRKKRHEGRGNENECDQHNREGAGLGKLQLRHAFENAGCDERPVHGHQKDGGADGGHRVDEEVLHARENRRQHKRDRNRGEGLHGRGPEASARLLNRGVDLRERGDHIADARRRVAEDVGRNEDVDRAGEHQRLVVEGDDVGDADHGAGQRVVQKRGRLQRLAPAHFEARCHIAHHDGKQAPERRADAGDQQRVLDRLHAVREDVLVVGKRHRVVHAPDLDHAAEHDDRIDGGDEREHRGDHKPHEGGEKRSRPVDAASAARLAAYCDKVLAAHPVVLQQIDRKRRDEQHEGERRAALEVIHAGDLQIGLRG